MSLMDLAAGILEEGWDPKKDSVNEWDNLPDGTYYAMLENVEWRVSDSGFEWLNLVFEITDGEHEGKKFFGMISFNNEQFQARNIKLAMQTAAAVGVTLQPEDFAEPETALVEAFQDGLGQEVDLTLTTWTSKKTGKSGQNFECKEPQFE